MEIFELPSCTGAAINERIARKIFAVLPARGPIIMIVDSEDHIWASDSERFSQLGISNCFLKQMQTKIDDSPEPVITQVSDCSVIGARLSAVKANCGYVLIALPQYSPESTLINIGLVETLVNQIGLIGELIEQNSLLHQLRSRQFSLEPPVGIASN